MAVLTPNQALSSLESGKSWPVYYLYGDEPFKINEFVAKVQDILFPGGKSGSTDFCTDRIDGSTVTGSDVLAAVQSMGLFGGAGAGNRRLVLVRQAHQLKEVDALAETLMEAGKTSPWGDNVLVLIAQTLDGRRKFHQWLKKSGYALEFKPAREGELLQWVQYLARKTGATLGPGAAEMLAVASDGSLFRLAQEVEKAWLFAGAKPGTEVTTGHVAATNAGKVTHEMVELVKAILDGKRARSLLLTENLIQGSDDALGLVGFLTWAIKSSGRGFGGAGITVNPERCRDLVEALVELDLRLKTSGLDPNALVEEFVITQTHALA